MSTTSGRRIPAWALAAAWTGAFAIGSYGAGCAGRDPSGASAYERCDSELEAAPCSDGTVCLGVNPFGESVESPGQLCTAECITAQDCPTASGFEAACESFTIGRRCILRCASDASAECPVGLYCADTARQNGQDVRVCL